MALRFNNPGNIRLIKKADGTYPAAFVGELRPGANGFRVFDNCINGFRAMFTLLKNGYINAGYNTLNKILPRYAPAADNNSPTAYINTVSRLTGIDANQELKTYADLLPIVQAMAHVETGTQIDAADVRAALNSIYNPFLFPTIQTQSGTQPGTQPRANFYTRYKNIILPVGALVALYGINKAYRYAAR